MLDYSNWRLYEGAAEGSGRSEKCWLINSDGEIGLFKFTKTKETKEHISEKLAADIASLICIECAKIDIGTYNFREGCMSYLINKKDEILIEGISLINRKFPFYDPNTLYDTQRQEYYSLEMIIDSIREYNLELDFFKILIFDFIIGNSDRHQNNWAILQNSNEIRMCPLYDNGSSLCCYIGEKNLDSYFGNDKLRVESLSNSKSRSRIRVDGKVKKEPTHLQMIEYIKNEKASDELLKWVHNIPNTLTENSIEKILNGYSLEMLSEKRKKLIYNFILKKVELLVHTFIGKED